jgi:hypothetical protein
MKVGSAVVFVEQTGARAVVEASDEIYVVASPTPEEAFDKASEAIRECVRIVGERIADLAAAAKPSEITVEFSLGFEASGQASFIPILFQAKATATTALKVSAVWKLDGQAE